MEGTERMLVQRLVRQGDAQSLAAIMRQYAGMVYGTCRRVLGNDADAADAAQETFYQLLKNANQISGSLSGWLHQVATRRAIDLVRQDAARRRREKAYATEAASDEDNWETVQPLVDEALEELTDESREVLILHYLKGQSMEQSAAARGLSQPTISRRIAAGLEQLRERLRAKDLVVGSTSLGFMLAGSAEAAPEIVLHGLGKMALAHAAASGATAIGATSTPVVASGAKTALAIIGLAVAIPSAWFVAAGKKGPPLPPTPIAVTWDHSGGFLNRMYWTSLALYTNGVLVRTQFLQKPYPFSVVVADTSKDGVYSSTLSWFRNGVLITNQTVTTTNPALLFPPAPDWTLPPQR